jgi:tetratricopeptide (TPR) repeat protein
MRRHSRPLIKNLSTSHPFLSVRNVSYLSSIHCHQKDYRKAEAEARRALELNQQAYTVDHPRSLTAMGLLSKVLICAGQPNRAAPILRDAMEKLEKVRNKNEYTSLEAVGMLGECMTLLKRYEEAEQLLTESLQGFQAIRGEKSPDMVEARQRLVKLYEAWGKQEQAARFRTG